MPCIFCDQTPDTVNAVATLDRVKQMLKEDEPLDNVGLLDALYEKIQEVHRLRRGLANAGQEHDRQARVISELQRTVEEYQLREPMRPSDWSEAAERIKTGKMRRHEKPWNNTRMWGGQ